MIPFPSSTRTFVIVVAALLADCSATPPAPQSTPAATPPLVRVQKVPLGPGPVLVVTEGNGAAGEAEVVRVVSSGEPGPSRELLRTEPGVSMFPVWRLDRQRLLVAGGAVREGPKPAVGTLRRDSPVPEKRLHIVDAEAGTCRELGIDGEYGFRVFGSTIVFFTADGVGFMDWMHDTAPLRVVTPLLRLPCLVGDDVFSMSGRRLVRVRAADRTVQPLGPEFADDASLSISRDGRYYAVGTWSSRDGGDGPDDGIRRRVHYATIAVREMRTHGLIASWDDEATIEGRVPERPAPLPPLARWVGDDEIVRYRFDGWDVPALCERLVRNVRTGEERVVPLSKTLDETGAPTWWLPAEAWARPASPLRRAIAKRGMNLHMPSPDGAWFALHRDADMATSTIVIESRKGGVPIELGLFPHPVMHWLRESP